MEVHVRPYYWAFSLSATFGAPYQMICRLLLPIVLATLSYQPHVTNLSFCAPVTVFLCHQKYSHSFTQEVSLEEISTRRRKDQRWRLQGKPARKVFLWFLSWPKDWMDAERHHRAIQLVRSRETPCDCWVCSFPSDGKIASSLLPHLHRSSSFLKLLKPRFPGNGCVAWHLQLRMRCPWAQATYKAELAMKNECFWGNNTLKLYVGGCCLKNHKNLNIFKAMPQIERTNLVPLWTEHRHYVCEELKPLCSSFVICVIPG